MPFLGILYLILLNIFDNYPWIKIIMPPYNNSVIYIMTEKYVQIPELFSPVGQRNWTGNDATNSNECFAGSTSDSFPILIVKYYLLFSPWKKKTKKNKKLLTKRNFSKGGNAFNLSRQMWWKLWENRPQRWCLCVFSNVDFCHFVIISLKIQVLVQKLSFW